MSNSQLKQLFCTPSLWNSGVHTQIKNTQNNMYFQTWYNCQSRTLTGVLNSFIGDYSRNNHKAVQLMYTMCALIKNNIPLKIYPLYLTISTEMSQNLEENLQTYLRFPNTSESAFNIVLYHIPKGKTFLKNVLDKNENLSRLKQIETFCINGPQHFIRIYHNFNGSGLNTVTIFSDYYSTDLLQTLWILLPHLMGITPRVENENHTFTDEDITYNTRVQLLYKFFDIFYQTLQTTSTQEYDSNELIEITRKFQKITKDYANQFDFVTGALNSFTSRLANTKNKSAKQYFEKELTRTLNSIHDYENYLHEKYITKMRLERQLNAVQNTSEEDVKPFIDTILNTKAIEVLSSAETKLTLKVTAPLQYFQESDFEAYENNPSSTYNQLFKDNPTLWSIFHKTFVTREYKIILQAIIQLSIRDGYFEQPLYVYAEKSAALPNLTEFPNPHLYHYDCWGNAKNIMNKYVCEGNYELAVMQMVAAVQTVNIAENASFVNGLLYDIKNSSSLRNLLTFIVNTPNGPQHFKYDQILQYEQGLQLSALQKAQPTKKYVQIELPNDDDEDNT